MDIRHKENGRLPFLVLNFGLDIVNGIGRFNFQSDGLASQRLDKNLHAATETENKMEGRLFLDVVIRKGSSIFKLFARKDEALLVGRDTAPRQINKLRHDIEKNSPLFVLDLGLYIVDGIRRLHFKSDCLASKGFNEDLHG